MPESAAGRRRAQRIVAPAHGVRTCRRDIVRVVVSARLRWGLAILFWVFVALLYDLQVLSIASAGEPIQLRRILVWQFNGLTGSSSSPNLAHPILRSIGHVDDNSNPQFRPTPIKHRTVAGWP